MIFKVIEKRLQKTLPNEEVRKHLPAEWMAQTEELSDEDVFPKAEVKEKTVQTIEFMELPKAKPTVMKKAPIVEAKPEERKIKEKIDPRKLVIYSELMKPKYEERDLV